MENLVREVPFEINHKRMYFFRDLCFSFGLVHVNYIKSLLKNTLWVPQFVVISSSIFNSVFTFHFGPTAITFQIFLMLPLLTLKSTFKFYLPGTPMLLICRHQGVLEPFNFICQSLLHLQF